MDLVGRFLFNLVVLKGCGCCKGWYASWLVLFDEEGMLPPPEEVEEGEDLLVVLPEEVPLPAAP